MPDVAGQVFVRFAAEVGLASRDLDGIRRELQRLARQERYDAPDWLIPDPPTWQFAGAAFWPVRIDLALCEGPGTTRDAFRRFLADGTPYYSKETI